MGKRKHFIKKVMIITILVITASLPFCYASDDKIDASKLNGYYLEPYDTENNNKFINGYGIIQNSIGYSRSMKFGIIDENYNVIIKPDTYYQIEFDTEDRSIIYAYVDPYARLGDIYRVTDKGLVKITAEMYYMYYSYLGNNATMRVMNKQNEYGVIDKNGKFVMPFTFVYDYHMTGNFIMRYKRAQAADSPSDITNDTELFDSQGNLLTDSKYNSITVYFENYPKKDIVAAIIVQKDNKVNLLDINDYKELLDWSSYKSFNFDVESKYIIAEDFYGKVGLLDKNAKIIVDFVYDEISWTKEAGFIGYRNGYQESIQLPGEAPESPTILTAKLPAFNITLNGVKIQNDIRLYPFIVYNDITYFPMTYYDSRFLGLETEWDTVTGLKGSQRQ